MHEEAVLQDLARKIREVAAQEGEARITRVELWVGTLSHLTESVLRQEWPRVTEGGPAEGAALDATFSTDPFDPRAQSVILVSVAFPSG